MPAEVFGPCSWDIGESESKKVASPLPQFLAVFFIKNYPGGGQIGDKSATSRDSPDALMLINKRI